jgi:hypothetical protein
MVHSGSLSEVQSCVMILLDGVMVGRVVVNLLIMRTPLATVERLSLGQITDDQ